MKYYYDCPLEAAWMAEKHGMQIHDDIGPINSHSLQEAGYFTGKGVKFYISPESTHILQPQPGDISYGGFNGVWRVTKDYEHISVSVTGKIIQRDGLAFHWPKSDIPIRE